MPEITPSKYLVMAGWDDVPHLDEKTKRELLESTPEYLRDARSKGIPTLGSGAVFPIKEENIKCDPFPIPAHWPRICGLDFGWDHPTAASWLAWDRDADIVYVYDCYAASKTVIPIHASAIKGRGDWIPVAWPHDGYQVKDAMQGEQLAQQYRNEKVNMIATHAKFEETGVEDERKQSLVSVEAGIQEMLNRFQTGRLKVFSTLTEWFGEYRLYRRDKGVIVKLIDDRICSTRYGLMMLRFAITEPVDDAGAGRRPRNWRVM
jgi:hypothetical protein